MEEKDKEDEEADNGQVGRRMGREVEEERGGGETMGRRENGETKTRERGGIEIRSRSTVRTGR